MRTRVCIRGGSGRDNRGRCRDIADVDTTLLWLNNARLLPFGLYDQWVPAFAAL